MQSINFDRGNYKEFAINGDENNTIKINISDLGIMTRLQDVFKRIDGIIEDVKQKEGQKINTADLLKEQDGIIRGMINEVFDADICAVALGNINAFSVASNGKPVVVNLLEALCRLVIQEIKSAQTAEQIKLEDKTEKYTKPITSVSGSPFIPYNKPSREINIDNLTSEEKNALLKELLK